MEESRDYYIDVDIDVDVLFRRRRKTEQEKKEKIKITRKKVNQVNSANLSFEF